MERQLIRPGLVEAAMLAWLESGARAAVYALADGIPLYCNDAFRRTFARHEDVLAEIAARTRALPDHAPAGSPPRRLPMQPMHRSGEADAGETLLAQEWLVTDGGRNIVIGCILPPANSPSTDHALLRVALHDALTDLPNRSLFEDRLFRAIARARRNRRLAALLYADLDGFKPINDRYGHQAGDIVLQIVSGRMMACVRETDTVARLGGDEFAVVLDDLRTAEDAERTAAKLIAGVSEPIVLPDGACVQVSCSIGVSLCPTNGTSLRALVRAADEAMYVSKHKGKGRYTLSTEPPDDAEEHWMDDAEAELLGVPEIDDQHATLIDLANRLYHAIQGTHDYDLQATLLDELVSFTQYHFSSEEALMDRYGDPGAESHKRQHAQLIAQVQFFRHALSHSDGQMVLSALRPWLIRHIKTSDRALAAYLAEAIPKEQAEESELGHS